MLRIVIPILFLLPFSVGIYVVNTRSPATKISDLECSRLLTFMIKKEKTIEIGQLLRWPGLSADLLSTQLDERLLRIIQLRYQNPKMAVSLDPNLKIEISDIPYDESSGDFWRIVRFKDSKISFFIGDGAGHGLKPAIESVRLHQFFDDEKNLQRMAEVLDHIDASETLKYIDARTQFIDPIMGLSNVLIDTKTGKLDFAKAGMPDDLIIKKADGRVVKIHATGGHIGQLQGSKNYGTANSGNHSFQLDPGDCVIMLSDGISDSNIVRKDIVREVMGETEVFQQIVSDLGDHLFEIITTLPADPMALKKGILKEVTSKHDDITLIIFRWHP